MADDAEAAEAELALEMVQPGDTVIDVGLESEIPFGSGGALAYPTLVDPEGGQPGSAQPGREKLEAVVAARKGGRVTVPVGRPGTGDDEDDVVGLGLGGCGECARQGPGGGLEGELTIEGSEEWFSVGDDRASLRLQSHLGLFSLNGA